MGTAFVNFYEYEFGHLKRDMSRDIALEIGRIVFRSLLETMESERPNDSEWKGRLDAAYGMKGLYIFNNRKENSEGFDFGPALLNAIQYLRKNGPPDYYPEKDIDLMHEQLDQLEAVYLQFRLE